MSFSDRLNTLMQLTGTTNIKLARALSVDPSLVSRWRNGSRRPANDPEIFGRIALFMVQKAGTGYYRTQLARAAGASDALEDEDLTDALVGWLSSTGGGQQAGPGPQGSMPPPTGSHRNSALIGPAGRQAALKRLYEQYDSDAEDSTIRFYSNDSVNWLKADIRYRRKLGIKDPTLFDNVQHVKLLLHTNAGEDELVAAIYYVMPFLRNGTVHIAHTPRYQQELFAHTFLIAGQSAAAASHSFAGSSNFMVNVFSNRAFIQSLAADFDAAFGECEPIHTVNQSPTPLDLIGDIDEMMMVDEPIIFSGNTLPGPVVPPQVYQQVNARLANGGGEWFSPESMALYRRRYNAFIQKQKAYLFFPLYSPAEVEDGAATAAFLPRFQGSEAALTPAEYLEVLRHLHQEYQKHPNLVVHIIPELSHEHYLVLQPNALCCAVKNMKNGVVYKTRVGGYIAAFQRYLAEKYGPPDQVEAQRATQLDKLAKAIATFAAYTGG